MDDRISPELAAHFITNGKPKTVIISFDRKQIDPMVVYIDGVESTAKSNGKIIERRMLDHVEIRGMQAFCFLLKDRPGYDPDKKRFCKSDKDFVYLTYLADAESLKQISQWPEFVGVRAANIKDRAIDFYKAWVHEDAPAMLAHNAACRINSIAGRKILPTFYPV